ncbi:MAG: prepilin-type N-terminal cleavage/methylation domain-containing protein [Lentisphaeraceae bacterium]|nr:prepilin-type N-terminal cleavage/methylation domain-containing protein [Lentisphaeraceae bacterium]
MKNGARNFTLIELLVVVAILGVLLSILLPALQKARQVTYQGVCINNQKQLNISFALFVDENNERFPGTYSEGLRWNERVNVYLRDNVEASRTGFINSITSPSSVWYCPAFTAFDSDMIGRPEYIHFAYNSKIIGGSNYNARYDNEELLGLQLGSIEGPADTLLMSDSQHWIHENRGILDHYEGNPGYRHSSGFDILFTDGHVEHKKEKSVFYRFSALLDGSWR